VHGPPDGPLDAGREDDFEDRLYDRKPQQRPDCEQPTQRRAEQAAGAGKLLSRGVALPVDRRRQPSPKVARGQVGGHVLPEPVAAVEVGDDGLRLSKLGERRLHQ
jgi:hypothetical protein